MTGKGTMDEIKNQIVIQSTMSWLVTIQNFNLIAQSVLKLSHCKKCWRWRRRRRQRRHPPGLNYSRDGKYSVADKNLTKLDQPLLSSSSRLEVMCISTLFVRDGILSVADYNSTRVGVVVVVVVVWLFCNGITWERFELSSWNFVWWLVMTLCFESQFGF